MMLRQKHGPFDYSQVVVKGNMTLEKRPVQDMENGAKYEGQWDVNTNKPHGQGSQEWPDGSVYEGCWDQGKVNGRGRLIHADGDVYLGDWVDGKAHGFGEYTHSDGAIYTG